MKAIAKGSPAASAFCTAASASSPEAASSTWNVMLRSVSASVCSARGLSSTTSTRRPRRSGVGSVALRVALPAPEPGGEVEGAPLPGLALDPDPPAHQLDQPLADGRGRGRCRRTCGWWTCRPG